MNQQLSQAIEESRQRGAQQYAQWDSARFDRWCAGPVQLVWETLATAADSDRRRTLHGYLMLVAEGIGRGYLSDPTGPARSFAEALIRDRVPGWLMQAPVGQRERLLAAAWNVAEGITREASWLDQYLLARIDALNDPQSLAEQLAALLDPVLQPLPAVSWTGPTRISVVDTRQADDEFLPGPMHWIAPRVLCVSDRRRDTNLGLLIAGGMASLVGPVGEVSPYQGADQLPELAWESGACRIAGGKVELPLFDEPLTHAVSASGFLIASTSNSQRLWVVESN